MTPELSALLQRIRQAGGPIREGWEYDHYTWDVVFPEKDKYGYTTFPVGPQEAPRAGPDSDAILIHALKLDALTRGVRSRTAHEPGRHRVWLYDEPGDQVGAAEHESEATAWCLAWLAAFEDTGE